MKRFHAVTPGASWDQEGPNRSLRFCPAQTRELHGLLMSHLLVCSAGWIATVKKAMAAIGGHGFGSVRGDSNKLAVATGDERFGPFGQIGHDFWPTG